MFQGGMLPLAPVKKVVQNLGSPAGSVISIDETLKICRFKLYVCIFLISFAKILCFEIENSSGLGPFLPSLNYPRHALFSVVFIQDLPQ